MADSHNVLVTGASGFTGRWLIPELANRGFKPASLSLIGSSYPAHEAAADIRNLESLTSAVELIRPTAVIHLAAISFVAHGNEQDFWNVNVEGSRNLLRALKEADCKPEVVIMASSANVYGNSAAEVISETEPARPANAYAESKLAMEEMALEWVDALPITVVRPFNYTGVGQAEHFLVPKIIKHFRERAPTIELGNLDVARDFSDVRDVAKIYAELLQARPHAETVNICSGKTYTLECILEICSELTGHYPNIEVNPEFVRDNEVKSLSGDPSKLQSLIGDIGRHSFRNTLEWMLNNP